MLIKKLNIFPKKLSITSAVIYKLFSRKTSTCMYIQLYAYEIRQKSILYKQMVQLIQYCYIQSREGLFIALDVINNPTTNCWRRYTLLLNQIIGIYSIYQYLKQVYTYNGLNLILLTNRVRFTSICMLRSGLGKFIASGNIYDNVYIGFDSWLPTEIDVKLILE